MAKRFPVIDGEVNGDIYGYATTTSDAKTTAGRFFVDPVLGAYFTNEPITLRDGTTCPNGAFVATTFELTGGRTNG